MSTELRSSVFVRMVTARRLSIRYRNRDETEFVNRCGRSPRCRRMRDIGENDLCPSFPTLAAAVHGLWSTQRLTRSGRDSSGSTLRKASERAWFANARRSSRAAPSASRALTRVARQADCLISRAMRARMTFAKMSLAVAVQTNRFGARLWTARCATFATVSSATERKTSRRMV